MEFMSRAPSRVAPLRRWTDRRTRGFGTAGLGGVTGVAAWVGLTGCVGLVGGRHTGWIAGSVVRATRSARLHRGWATRLAGLAGGRLGRAAVSRVARLGRSAMASPRCPADPGPPSARVLGPAVGSSLDPARPCSGVIGWGCSVAHAAGCPASRASTPAGGVRDPDPAEDDDRESGRRRDDVRKRPGRCRSRSSARHRRELADELVVGERLVDRSAQRASDVGAG